MGKIDLEIIKAELKGSASAEAKPVAVRPDEAQKALALSDPEYFRPTAKQRKLKQAFRAACKIMPNDRKEIVPDYVCSYVKSDDIRGWWGIPGFAAWFRRDEAIAERLQYLYHLRLDAIEEVLENDAGIYTARDKISAGAELDKVAKTIAEAQGAVDSVGKDTRSMEEKIKEAYDAAKKKELGTNQLKEVIVEAKSRLDPAIVMPNFKEKTK
jgi:hypothetical protein